MATPVYDWDKKKLREVALPAEIFEYPLRRDILQGVVRWQQACRRQGTHMTKTRGLVRGGGKKPFRQKGTGNARQGSTRSPLMPGGGTAFGPQPKTYDYALPKKVRQVGLKVALSYLNAQGRLFVVNEMSSGGRTAELFKRLKKFGLLKAVLVDSDENILFRRAARNLGSYRYYSVVGMNVLDLLKYDGAIVTESSLSRIAKRCGLEGGHD